MSLSEVANEYAILLVCDFAYGLLSRILDVYRFFEKPPRIVIVRRGRPVRLDPRSPIQLEVVSLPSPIIGFESSGLFAFLSALPLVVTYLAHAFALYIRIREHVTLPVRLVHAHYVLPQGLLGLLLARLFRVPLFVTAVGSDVNIDMKRSIILRALSVFVLRHAYQTIAVSKPLQLALNRAGIVDAIYVPNSVDTNSISTTERSISGNSILFVGSMIEPKRPMLLLRAFERVVREVPSATLLMCGEGPLRPSLEEEIKRKGLQDKISLFSNLSPQSVISLYSQADLFVLPSVSEGLSLSLLEAMAAGKAIVASRNESHEEMLKNGENSLLFEVDNCEDLTKQILLALTDRKLRHRISESARQLCEKQFSNEVAAKKLEDLYSTCSNTTWLAIFASR
jgi:glycosyltransferase involved in cell wall biosynthesis